LLQKKGTRHLDAPDHHSNKEGSNMKKVGSKHRNKNQRSALSAPAFTEEVSHTSTANSTNCMGTSDPPVVANSPESVAPPSINAEDPEFIAALGIIVSAFVDLGFGVSAEQQVSRIANDNQDLIRLAANFPNQSS
jgi:hypothetical protein